MTNLRIVVVPWAMPWLPGAYINMLALPRQVLQFSCPEGNG
jgi:hypothetical protein